MMTLDELQKSTINAGVAREAHSQAEKRLGDALATKASHEQKAFALMAAYITVALALLTTFVFLADGRDPTLAPAFLVVGGLFVLGAALCGLALLPQTYGALGSDPSAWLRQGVIDGGDAALPATLAYEAFFHHKRIQASLKANGVKARLIRAGVVSGLVAPLALCVWIWLLV